MMSCDLDREKLHAYADESLAPEELAAVEQHLRECAACAAEALALVQMKRATRAAAASLTLRPEFRMRPEFRQQMEKSMQGAQRPTRRRAWLQGLAAAALALLLIAVSTAVLTQRAGRDEAVAEGLDLHVAALASTNPVDVVSTDRHTVKPWFQGKLPFTFNLPELEGSPYKLLGGKLVYLEHNPAAQLLFEIRKHQISVFLAQEREGLVPLSAAVTTTSERGFSVETWREGGLRYVAISDTNPADVHALGELLRGAGR
jgi:anti-sigma factor RsiW